MKTVQMKMIDESWIKKTLLGSSIFTNVMTKRIYIYLLLDIFAKWGEIHVARGKKCQWSCLTDPVIESKGEVYA